MLNPIPANVASNHNSLKYEYLKIHSEFIQIFKNCELG